MKALCGFCRRCNRSERPDRHALLALLARHGDLHLRALHRRLRCATCGARDAELIRAAVLTR